VIAMTVPEFAERIRVSRSTAYELVASRQIEVTDVSTRGKPQLRITEAAMEAFLKRRQIPAKAA
jgi:excisionase family DNA binding protein